MVQVLLLNLVETTNVQVDLPKSFFLERFEKAHSVSQ